MANNKLLATMIRILNGIIPKSLKKIYLFSTFLYKDNIQAILDEMIQDGFIDRYLVYCDGPAFSTYNHKNVFHVKHGTLKSFLAFFMSKYVIYDIGIYGQIKGGKNQYLVNTWHGTSLKRIEYYLEKNMRKGMPPLCTYSIAYSDFFKPVIQKAFGLDEEHVLVSGEPRNDYLFSENKSAILGKLGITHKYRSLVIWMPTWRQNREHLEENDGESYPYGIPFLTESSLDELNKECVKNDCLLIIKWHGLQDQGSICKENYPGILFLTSEDIAKTNMPLYYLVGCCDGLITDYSSIYVNYAVLNRPICFAYDDIESYKNNRGFMFENVEDIMPGYHVHSMGGIIDFIHDTVNNVDRYISKREETEKKLNTFSDDKNSYRLLKQLGIV